MSGAPHVQATLQSTPFAVELSDDLGHTWLADEPLEAGGGNTATSPDRLMLASLGACTAITVKMVAQRRNIPLVGIRVELTLNPAGRPAEGNDIVRTIRLQGELTPEQQEQLLKMADRCPMHRLLTGEVRITTKQAS